MATEGTKKHKTLHFVSFALFVAGNRIKKLNDFATNDSAKRVAVIRRRGAEGKILNGRMSNSRMPNVEGGLRGSAPRQTTTSAPESRTYGGGEARFCAGLEGEPALLGG